MVLLAVRVFNAISFQEPLQLFTSGAEHESLYGIWRQIHGLAVYNDPAKIPYVTSSYYNWFYFEFYGWVTALNLWLFSLDEAWIPTITRLTALATCVAGAVLLYRSMVFMAPPRAGWQRALAVALVGLFFFGPLAGWWPIATNVEFFATVLLIASMHVFCRYYSDHPVRAVLLFCLFAYLSWSMKQVYVYSCGAVGLYLLFRRDWRSLFLLVAVMAAAWAMTFVIGSKTYAGMLFLSDTGLEFSLPRLGRNLMNVGVKTLPVTLGLVAVVVVLMRAPDLRKAVARQRYFWLFVSGSAVTALFVIPASTQLGAAENYFLPLFYYLTMVLYMAVCGASRNVEAPAGVSLAMSAGWLATIAAVAIVLAGLTGALSTRQWHDRHLTIKACLDRMPDPLFTTSAYNLLPWMHQAPQHFILTYYYFRDRKAGRKFERDGIGGLISEGYFASLLLGRSITEKYDGGSLARYRRRPGLCANQVVWLRRDIADRR